MLPALFRIGVLLCLAAGTKQFLISEFEVPDEVVVGKDAELRCQYQLASNETEAALYVKWWWTPATSSSDDRKLIYQRIAGHLAEAVHNNNSCEIEIKEKDTIVLKELQPRDSGSYECEVSNIDEIRKHDVLTVYTQGSGPHLNISSIVDGPDEGDVEDVLIQCEAENVAPAPSLILFYNGNPVEEITEILSESDGLYAVFANATLSKEKLEAGEIQCQMIFPLQNFTHPAYVDIQEYDPAGESATTTEMPGVGVPDPSPGSLQIPSDDGHRLHCSWALLAAAAILTNFIALK